MCQNKVKTKQEIEFPLEVAQQHITYKAETLQFIFFKKHLRSHLKVDCNYIFARNQYIYPLFLLTCVLVYCF